MKGEVVTLVIMSQIAQMFKVPILVIQRAALQKGVFFCICKKILVVLMVKYFQHHSYSYLKI